MKFQEIISILFKLFQIIQKSETFLSLVSETKHYSSRMLSVKDNYKAISGTNVILGKKTIAT